MKTSIQPTKAPKQDAWKEFEEWGGKSWFPKSEATTGKPKPKAKPKAKKEK